MRSAAPRPAPPWPAGAGAPPRLIGHRGAAAHAPENTLAGLHKAAAEGVRWVEVDARLSADDVPVLLHDDDLDRTTDGRGAVRALPAAALRGLDAGRWFGDKFAGEAVPLLTDAVNTCRDLKLGLNVELKTGPGDAVATGEIVGAALAELDAQDTAPARALPLLISSFNRTCLAAAATTAPTVARALNVTAPSDDDLAWARDQGCAAVHLAREAADAASLATVAKAGFLAGVFTVNDAAEAARLFAAGAAYVFTDDPRALGASPN